MQPQRFVRVRRVAGAPGDEDETFGKVPIDAADDVSDVAARACAAFGWGAPTRARLYLAAAGGAAAPTEAAIAAALGDAARRLGEGTPLADAGVASGAWLLAHIPPMPAVRDVAGGGIDVADAFRARVADYDAAHVVPLAPLTDADLARLASDAAFLPVTAKLARGAPLADAEVARVVMQLLRVVTPTTARRFSSETAYVIDGAVPSAPGQAGVEILYAFEGSRLLCAKVGTAAAITREHAAAAAVHAACAAPTVLRALALAPVPRRGAAEPFAALLMPLCPLTVGAAAAAMDVSAGAAAREAFSLNVATCALAAVAACSLAGLAHGDVKPSNLLLAGDGSGLVLLADFGTARAVGDAFTESSAFSLNLERAASLRYDVVSLGATLASVLSARVNVGACADAAALRAALGGLGAAERAAPLWRFVDACLDFPDGGGARELAEIRAALAGVVDSARARLGRLGEALVADADVWPRVRA
jgi:hypothetical protein